MAWSLEAMWKWTTQEPSLPGMLQFAEGDLQMYFCESKAYFKYKVKIIKILIIS